MYELTDPFESGFVDVGDGHRIHYDVAGNPDGKPAVILHGGPGSGSRPNTRRMFDPVTYRIVQFDQRNSGRSEPSAAQPIVDLSANTTSHLIDDIEQLRVHLGIEAWLVWGGSWGTTLGLAYAEAHTERVTELLLASVVTTSRAEVEWVTRTMGRVFPEQWTEFRDGVPASDRDDNLALAYNRLLMDPDPAVHEPAALDWCTWEDVHVSIATGFEPSLTESSPEFRLTFARLVTHYWSNAGFIEDGLLLDNAHRLAGIPTFLAHGRRDISGPADVAVAFADAIPGAELFIAEDAEHGGRSMTAWMISVTDRLC